MASRMRPHPPLADGGWTKPVVIYGLALLVIPLGVFCDFYYAARGELGLAAIWMMITLCSIGVLGLYVRFVTLRHQLRGQTKALDRLRHELDSMHRSARASIQHADRRARIGAESPPPSFSPNIARLRREFAHHVRDENFADALATGEEIAVAFPDSAAAEEFRRLRPILQRRLGSTAAVDNLIADPVHDSMIQASAQAEREPPIMAL